MSTIEREWAPSERIEDLFQAFSSIGGSNAPTAGARLQEQLPEGNAALQLYSLATPNGMKIGIVLEELGVDYDAHVISILKGDQFKSGFVDINPNSKIPALVDKQGPNNERVRLFESGSIALYLAEKYHKLIPSDAAQRAEMVNWLFWQMSGLGPAAGAFGHFFVYAPKGQVEARDYGVYRYGMETMRLLSVLDQHLEGRTYIVGESYTIADIVSFTWVHTLRTGERHSSGITAAQYLGLEKYKNVNAWADRILSRPAVQRGITVCKGGIAKPWLVTSSA